MKLQDLRKAAIREQGKIHFRLRNGMECVVTENGIAQVPGLKDKPDFNLEEELSQADEFLFEPHLPKPPRKLLRAEMEAMVAAAPVVTTAHDHDDE